MKHITFDTKSFALAIDATRWAKKQSWKQVSEETDVSKPTLWRIQQGKSPDVNTLAKLLDWCGMDFKRFMLEENEKGQKA